MRRTQGSLAGAFVLGVAALAALAAPPAAGQDTSDADAGRWELGILGGWAHAAAMQGYRTSFLPRLTGHPEATGEGGQRLSLDRADAAAFGLAAAYRVSRRTSLELLAVAHTSDLGGANGPYTTTLRYDTRQPPDYVPRPIEVTDSRAWPATDGKLRQLSLALNLATRFGRDRTVSCGVSGGIAAYRVTGSLEPVGFTAYTEGGHSTLMGFLYKVRVGLAPAWAAGLDAGGDVSLRVGRHVRLVLDVRYFWGREVAADARVDRVLETDSSLQPLTAAEVGAAMALPDVRVDPSFLAVTAGVRLAF